MNRATNIPIVANPTHATTIKIALKKTRKQTIEISHYSAHGEQGGGSKLESINRQGGYERRETTSTTVNSSFNFSKGNLACSLVYEPLSLHYKGLFVLPLPREEARGTLGIGIQCARF